MQGFEILSDVIKGPMHENPQRISSVVRVDVSGPYLQGVNNELPKCANNLLYCNSFKKSC